MHISTELIEIVGPALAVGLMIAVAHAPLGIEVLRRGIIFIDLAIAQVAGLGVVIANTALTEPVWWVVQIAALGCAVTAALFFRWMEARFPQQQEAVIGCSFVLAATLALLLLANHPHGGEEIEHLLSGQILFATWHDVYICAPVYAAIIALWFLLPAIRNGIGFYLLFAVAVTTSVQMVGVYVVFASLILPALAVTALRRYQNIVACLCGMAAVLGGVWVSAAGDYPSGPLMVIAYAVMALILNAVRWSFMR